MPSLFGDHYPWEGRRPQGDRAAHRHEHRRPAEREPDRAAADLAPVIARLRASGVSLRAAQRHSTSARSQPCPVRPLVSRAGTAAIGPAGGVRPLAWRPRDSVCTTVRFLPISERGARVLETDTIFVERIRIELDPNRRQGTTRRATGSRRSIAGSPKGSTQST
jgi:hypothetical protein